MPEPDSPPVLVDRDGPVATITLNRPRVLNALDTRALAALVHALRAQTADDGVRVVILTGAGRAFTAGDDLREAGALDPDRLRAHIANFQEVTRIVRGARQPVVASMPGGAYGGGLEIALGCDFRLAVEGASFGCPEVRLGVTLSNGSSVLLPRLIGDARARDLVMGGEPIAAEEALAIGLVNEVVPRSQLEAATRRLVDRLLLAAPTALALTKRLLNDDLDAVLDRELEAVLRAHESPDVDEGMRAFAERRAPDHRAARLPPEVTLGPAAARREAP